MPTIQSTRLRRTTRSVLWIAPGLHIDRLPAGTAGDPIRSPAVRIRRKRSDEGSEEVVVYLPEVEGLIDALA